MKVAFFIAWRYLFAKKSRQVINTISWISVGGIALGTLALVIVMSVYNGFDNLVKGMYNTFNSDLVIKAVTGKTIPLQTVQGLWEDPALGPVLTRNVTALCPVIEEDVFLQYRGQQSIATMKAVDSVFMATSPLKENLYNGRFEVYFGEVEEALVGRALGLQLGVNHAFVDPLWIYYPKADAAYQPLNPMASLNREKLFPSGMFSVEQQYDSQYLFVPLATARRLLGYTDQVTYVELRTAPGVKTKGLKKQLTTALGPTFKVLTRYEQNETLYKMMRTEKVVIFLLLGFIVLIISCNVLGSLSMLILEKKDDVQIMESMGARPVLIHRIFLLEGWLISLLGLAVGMAFGLLICWIQQTFGLITLPGSFMVSYYPVDVQFTDMIAIIVTVVTLGFLAAYAPVRSFFSKSISKA